MLEKVKNSGGKVAEKKTIQAVNILILHTFAYPLKVYEQTTILQYTHTCGDTPSTFAFILPKFLPITETRPVVPEGILTSADAHPSR